MNLRHASIIFCFVLLSACRTFEPLVSVPHNDSIHIREMYHLDSIFIHDSISVATIHDTVFVDRWHTNIRYSIKHHTDTVYHDKQVIVTLPPERYIPAFYKWCTGILIGILILIVLYFVVRILIRR